jgi:hypothetical protein
MIRLLDPAELDARDREVLAEVGSVAAQGELAQLQADPPVVAD